MTYTEVEVAEAVVTAKHIGIVRVTHTLPSDHVQLVTRVTTFHLQLQGPDFPLKCGEQKSMYM